MCCRGVWYVVAGEELVEVVPGRANSLLVLQTAVACKGMLVHGVCESRSELPGCGSWAAFVVGEEMEMVREQSVG